MESDLNRIANLPAGDGAAFAAELDRIINANFTNDYWAISLPNRLDNSSPRSPALFAYLAALNLLDADVLFSEVKVGDLLDPTTIAPRSIERHHLFPRAYLAKHGVTAIRQVNAIANMAFLDWAENQSIMDKAPSEYLPVMSARVTRDRLRQQIHLHALPIGWEQLDYPTFLERRRMLIAKVVQEGFNTFWGTATGPHEMSLRELINAGESQTIEFKSTARFNSHTGQSDSRLEHVIVKTVCGFLNAEGGTLLVGVDDDGNALGLDGDISTLTSKPNIDGYELFLRQLLDVNLSVNTAATVRIDFPIEDDRKICRVAVAPSGKPVFAKPLNGSGTAGEEFWVRIGNATNQLHGDQLLQYREDHWG